MPSRLVARTALFAVSALLALSARAESKKPVPACEKDQVLVKGACVSACPTQGGFPDAKACACPPGFGQVIHGSGGGDCVRLACAKDLAVDPATCDCPVGLEQQPSGKGKVKCVQPKAKAPSK